MYQCIAVSFHPMLLDAGNNHLAIYTQCSAQIPTEQDLPFPRISGGTSEEVTKPDKKLYSIQPNVNIYYWPHSQALPSTRKNLGMRLMHCCLIYYYLTVSSLHEALYVRSK